MGDFMRHEPCPECGSKDNLARYSDGSGYCFGCKHHEQGSGAPISGPPKAAGFSDANFLEGEYQALGKRGITADTCRKFSYKVGVNKSGKTVQIAEYIRDGKVVAQKLRTADKKFSVVGDGKHMPLFGQHLWRDGGKRLVITEGEIDAMSMCQVQDNRWPVVSVPAGAQSAVKAIAREIEFVTSFDIIVLCFDMDEPGREAALEVAEMLPPGRTRIMTLPLKDANEMLVAGRAKELIGAMWEAKTYRPAGVVGIEDVIDEACEPPVVGRPWPWESLTDATYGRRYGEMYGFGGGTGCGKSTLFKQIAAHILENETTPVGMLMLEEAVAHTAVTLAGMSIGQRLHVPGEEPDKAVVRKALTKLEGRAYFFDTRRDSYDFDTVVAKITYMARALGCRDIFLDHLTAIASQIDDDERKAIDKIMAKLATLAEQLNITLYYVSHLTTPDGKPHEEGGRVLERHFRGSRSIAFWSDFLFAIERDKQDPDGVTTFRVLKDRYTGDANGLTFGLAYNRTTGRLDECELPDPNKSPFPAHGADDDF
jgi:twinkle protein